MEWIMVNHGGSGWRPSQWQSAIVRRFRRRQIPAKSTETFRKAQMMKGHPGTQKFGDIPIYTHIYIYSVCLASFWGYSNAECSNYIEPTRKSCMTCCFLHPHFSWPAILSWRFREQALSTAALRQLWWRSWSAKRRSRALNSAISLQPRRGVRLFWLHRVWKIMLQKKGSGKDRKNNMEKNEQSLYESVKRFLWGLNRRVREIWSFCIFLQLTSKKKQYLTVLNF